MDVFDSAIRQKRDLAGVFEYDEADDPKSARHVFISVGSRTDE
ncbi:hypothetical protein [Mesorhizobium sp. M0323]